MDKEEVKTPQPSRLLTTFEVKEQLKKFKAPLQPSEVEWRVGSKSNDGTSVLAYIDNRTVYDRLDKFFGIHWGSSTEQDEGQWFHFVKEKKKYNKMVTYDSYVNKGGGFRAKIWINHDQGRIERMDAAGFSDVEPYKGGASDAFKRCAHSFGLGRELYRYPRVVIEEEWPNIYKYRKQLEQITTDFLAGRAKSYYKLSQTGGLK